MTKTQVCDSDAVTIVLQEVKTGYIKYTRRLTTYVSSKVYTEFKNEFITFLQQCETTPWEADATTKMDDYHGIGGTKSEGGVNSQISISFTRKNVAAEHSHIDTCPSLKPTEKGGMLIKITKNDKRALVVGVHLDSGKNYIDMLIS